ncbi:hypothetical protein [uncultured Brevundimonas sp.]|uniref:hypothetical protein n=1 Tax=uncultured Brevundimonas sp. TaxID=213418 RepID=UPI0026372929|nr:hypothetical protein [uncultured Brevundimonas sp.]
MSKLANFLTGSLKAIPLVRFVLMLGGGIMATLFVAVAAAWLTYGRFPDLEAVWLARITAVAQMGLAAWAVVVVVMITLAWGKVSGIKLSKGDMSAELDLDDSD